MMSIRYLSTDFAVRSALDRADFAAAARHGFATVVNFRPDQEVPGQMTSAEAQRAAHAVGLAYVHIPTSKYDVFADDLVSETARILTATAGPVLAYCASGQRAAILWAAAIARSTPADDVLAALNSAGFDLDFLRDDLEAQADRARWAQSSSDLLPDHSKNVRVSAAA